MDIQARLQTVMRRLFDQDSLTIHRELTASDVEGWDSLAHVHLIVAVEKEFKIRIHSTDLPKLKSVGDLIDLVQAKAS